MDFFWLHRVLAAANSIFHCGVRTLELWFMGATWDLSFPHQGSNSCPLHGQAES